MKISLLVPLLFSAFCHAVPVSEVLTGNVEPAADPTLCKDNSGTYFLFSTGLGIPIRTSRDRKNWTVIGAVWPNGSSWTDPYTGNSKGIIWAPDCTYINGKFWLYYSASSLGSQTSAIFLATSTTGQPGSWTNQGLVTSTTPSNNYNAIDPNLFVDGNNWYLSLGSYWTGIKRMTLNPSTGMLANTNVAAIAQRTANNGAVEGSVIFRSGNYYYLFTSWDTCCSGLNSNYNVRVGRSTSATGAFVDQSGVSLLNGGGTLVLGTHDKVIAPGGQDIYVDNDGPVMVYHYYNGSDPNADRKLGINRLDFSSGWPVVV